MVKTLEDPLQEAQILSVIGELSSCMPCRKAKKKMFFLNCLPWIRRGFVRAC